ncbi:hypothetical protein Tco_1376619 [Tanacetum coccineum]
MQNVLSPTESRYTSVAELPNTEVAVNQYDTFNNRKGMLMERDVNGESTSTSDNMLPKVATKEQLQVESLTKVVPQTVPKARVKIQDERKLI